MSVQQKFDERHVVRGSTPTLGFTFGYQDDPTPRVLDGSGGGAVYAATLSVYLDNGQALLFTPPKVGFVDTDHITMKFALSALQTNFKAGYYYGRIDLTTGASVERWYGWIVIDGA